jgi:hypothetical protein
MKIKRLMVMGSLMVALTMPPGRRAGSSFQVTVPFPFVVGNQTLPAGTYVMQRLLGKPKSAADVGVIVIKGGDHHVYKVIMTASGKESRAVGAAGSRSIFTSFKGREYLNRVCVAGDAVVRQLANVPSEVAAQGAGGEVIVTSLHNGKGK